MRCTMPLRPKTRASSPMAKIQNSPVGPPVWGLNRAPITAGVPWAHQATRPVRARPPAIQL